MKNTLLTILALCSATYMYSQDAYKDCVTSEQIIEMGHYKYSDIPGNGDNYESLGTYQDGAPMVETNSVWLMWEIEEGGEFVFDITPLYEKDDIDFALYKSESGCDEKESIRACLSGHNTSMKSSSEPCTGSTGLSYSSGDEFEGSGCSQGDDNYVRSVTAKKGDIYFLVINNYYEKSGFWFDIEGDISITNPDNAQQYGKLVLEKLSVYPNPASDFVQVELHDESMNIQNVQVIDANGKLIRKIQSPSPSSRIDVSELSSGSYFIIAEGKESIVRKHFIKQ